MKLLNEKWQLRSAGNIRHQPNPAGRSSTVLFLKAPDWEWMVVLEKVPSKMPSNELTPPPAAPAFVVAPFFLRSQPALAPSDNFVDEWLPPFRQKLASARIRRPPPTTFQVRYPRKKKGARNLNLNVCGRAFCAGPAQRRRAYTQNNICAASRIAAVKKLSLIQPEKLSLSCLFIYHGSGQLQGTVWRQLVRKLGALLLFQNGGGVSWNVNKYVENGAKWYPRISMKWPLAANYSKNMGSYKPCNNMNFWVSLDHLAPSSPKIFEKKSIFWEWRNV